MTSFYNAGSCTNFSNHAYKMGPVHYGTLERGAKTASGSHTLLPATVGAFTMCMGKIANHPDTHLMPFSYLIGDGRGAVLVPGKNIATVGLYRDITKWPRRDVRMASAKKTQINFDWLSPYTVNEILEGRKILADLSETQGEDAEWYNYKGCRISRNSLRRGLRLYNMAVELFIGEVLMSYEFGDQCLPSGAGEWKDLCGILLPLTEEKRIVEKIKIGMIGSLNDLYDAFKAYNEMYGDYLWTYTVSLMKRWLDKDELTEDDFSSLRERGAAARKAWLDEIRHDAEKEYSMGDVDRVTLDNFLAQLS